MKVNINNMKWRKSHSNSDAFPGIILNGSVTKYQLNPKQNSSSSGSIPTFEVRVQVKTLPPNTKVYPCRHERKSKIINRKKECDINFLSRQ